MNTQATAAAYWSTAATGQAPGMLEAEFAVLGAHLRMCRRPPGDLLALRAAGKTLRGFVTAHFVTTLGLLVLLIKIVSLLA